MRRQLALEEQVTMSSSGILDALRNEERSLKSQLVAIQRAIEAIEGAGVPTARRGRPSAALSASSGASASPASGMRATMSPNVIASLRGSAATS